MLVTIESLSSDYRLQMEAALEERNKERILTGQPRYEDIEDMVTKYQEFEGEKLGMSRAEAEDAVQRPYLASGIWPAAGSGGARACLLGPQVLSYLQKKALMDEGAYSGDPQEAPSAGKRRADSLRNCLPPRPQVITFVLLGALVVGVGYNLIVNGIPQ